MSFNLTQMSLVNRDCSEVSSSPLSRAHSARSSLRITAIGQGTVAVYFKGRGSCGSDKKFGTRVPQNLISVVQGVLFGRPFGIYLPEFTFQSISS